MKDELFARFALNRVSVVILSLAFLLFGVGAFAEDVYEIHPKPEKGYEVKDDKIFYRAGNAGLILELMNTDSIAHFYKDHGAQIGDPLTGLDSETAGATIFLLTLINRTHGTLTFTPNYAILKIKDEATFAMDFTVLLPMLDNLDQSTRKIVEDSVFHSPEVIQPGQVLTKFLLFPQLPKKFDEFKLGFDYIFFGDNKNSKCDFYFKHVKVKTPH